jgi:hypothetical protein
MCAGCHGLDIAKSRYYLVVFMYSLTPYLPNSISSLGVPTLLSSDRVKINKNGIATVRGGSRRMLVPARPA